LVGIIVLCGYTLKEGVIAMLQPNIQIHGMTDSQFENHLSELLFILENARKEIEGDAPMLDSYIAKLKGQLTKP